MGGEADGPGGVVGEEEVGVGEWEEAGVGGDRPEDETRPVGVEKEDKRVLAGHWVVARSRQFGRQS